MRCMPTGCELLNRMVLIDSCHVVVRGDGGWDSTPPGFTEASEISCLVKHGKPKETLRNGRITITNMSILLPLGTVIKSSDRIKVTKINSQTLASDELYAVKGDPNRKASHMECNVKRTTASSVD